MNMPNDTAASMDFSRLTSRLPDVGTTIFTVMSALATEKGAVNLGQGFPDFHCDPALVDALAGAVPVFVQMEVTGAGYSVPWQKVAAAVSPRTRLIMINSPHNPTGSVLR